MTDLELKKELNLENLEAAVDKMKEYYTQKVKQLLKEG